MAVFSPNTEGSISIIPSARLEFGITDSSEYVTPIAAFKFYKPNGDPLNNENPIIYIRMNSSFETSVRSPYQETEGIFGQPANDEVQNITNALGIIGRSGIEALQRQILNAAGAGIGFIASAGASGKSQVEFLRREVFNTFSQLLYRGPQFRPFQLSFSMRPKSYDEAKTMRNIIGVFKMASEARAGLKTSYNNFGGKGNINASEKNENIYTINKEGNDIQDANLEGLFRSDTADSNFTFGYPNLCSFEIKLLHNKKDISTIFESKICVIEGLSMTYGSQNKMTFFKDEGDNNIYFPTDVNFQISLKEVVYHTHSDSVREYERNTLTIL